MYIKMALTTRYRYPWNINECIQLQREFELLELPIDEIAARHKRTPNAIMFKLDKEGFADYNVLYSNYYGLNGIMPINNANYDVLTSPAEVQEYEDGEEEEEEEEEEEDDEQDDLREQVMRLEKQVIKLTEMLMNQNKNKSVFSLFS